MKKQKSRKQKTAKPKNSESENPNKQPEHTVNWYEKLNALEWEKHSRVLKDKLLPMRIVRFIIGSIYSQVRSSIALSIESICEEMLQTLFRAEIIQRGPKWDSFSSPRTMAEGFLLKIWKCLELDDDDAWSSKKTDRWIVRGHGIFGRRRGPVRESYYVVYRYYRALRIDNNWVLHAPDKKDSLKLWAEVWRLASQEPCVKTELENSPREVADFKGLAQDVARRTFLDEIRPLKEKTPTQHG